MLSMTAGAATVARAIKVSTNSFMMFAVFYGVSFLFFALVCTMTRVTRYGFWWGSFFVKGVGAKLRVAVKL